jgi:O-antigen/teichoic acid export membrane protein
MQLIPAFIYKHIKHRPNLLKILDNIGWLFVDKILRMGVGLLVGVWFARYLGPEQFGIVNFALAFTGLFGAIASLGLQSIVVRDLVRDPDSARLTLGTATLLHLIGGFVAFVLILIAIACLRPEDLLARSIVAILGAMQLFKLSEIAVYWFESQVKSKYVVWVQNIIFLVFAIIKVILIINEASLFVFVWLMLLEAFLIAVILLVILNRFGIAIASFRASIRKAISLLKDSWPLAISGLAVMAYMRIDQIMLAEMKGDNAVGFFSAGTRISEVWYFIPMSIVATVTPSLINAKNKSVRKYFYQTQKLYDWLVFLCIAVAIPVAFLSDEIISILYGKLYSDSAAVLAIHIWASIFVCLGVASSQNLLMENKQIIAMQRTLAGLVVNILLNIILIPKYGVIGASVATLFSQFMAAVFFDLFQRETRIIFKMKLKSIFLINLLSFARKKLMTK